MNHLLDSQTKFLNYKGMKTILQKLADSGLVKVAGSYATGNQTENSDIDFQVKVPKETVLYNARNHNMQFIVEILEGFGIKWNSTRTGYISTIGEDNNLEIEMEFYDDFHRNKDRLKTVEIMGVEFKTW